MTAAIVHMRAFLLRPLCNEHYATTTTTKYEVLSTNTLGIIYVNEPSKQKQKQQQQQQK